MADMHSLTKGCSLNLNSSHLSCLSSKPENLDKSEAHHQQLTLRVINKIMAMCGPAPGLGVDYSTPLSGTQKMVPVSSLILSGQTIASGKARILADVQSSIQLIRGP